MHKRHFRAALFAIAALGQSAFADTYRVPLLLSASNGLQQGFVRIANHSDASGVVAIHAIDDAGKRFGPIELALNARETKGFNSQDLELGNPPKGLMSGVGGGQGDWRLELETDLRIEPLAYARTFDGFLTSLHDVAAEADGRFWIPIFNPADNINQASRIRLVNPNEVEAELTIAGLDASGVEPGGGEVRITVPPGEVRTITARQLEDGGGDIAGSFNGGSGKWQLFVSATAPVGAMSLLESPSGHLTNLSTLAGDGLARTDRASSSTTHTIPLFLSASNAELQGFARIINRSEESGSVAVHAVDDSGRRFGPIRFMLEARATKQFNSDDLETGNPAKGLSAGVGAGQGDWRLEVESELDIEALAYVRSRADGFLTAMHDIVPEADGVMRAPTFNPGSNSRQRSLLRLVNPNAEDGEVVIRGLDSAGAAPPGGDVCIELPAGAAATVSAQQLETGSGDFAGGFGDGTGKWQLYLSSTVPILAMSLLESPTGHLTNLSTTPVDSNPAFAAAPAEGVDCATIAANRPVAIPDANLWEALTRILGKKSGAPILARELATLTSLSLDVPIGTDISPLSGLSKLESLSISYGGKTELEAATKGNNFRLSNLPKLHTLTVHGPRTAHRMGELLLSGSDFPQLQTLVVSDLRMSFLALRNFPNLTRVVVSNRSAFIGIECWECERAPIDQARTDPDRGLTEVELLNLPKLVELNLSGNSLSRPLSLAGLSPTASSPSPLRYLDLSFSSLSSDQLLSLSDTVPFLTEINLNYNLINDLSFVVGLNNLKVLHLEYNRLRELGALVEMLPAASLEELYLRGNRIKDIKLLQYLRSLKAIDLDFNLVENLSPLVDNETFSCSILGCKCVSLRGNLLSDESLGTHIAALKRKGIRVRRNTNPTTCGKPTELNIAS